MVVALTATPAQADTQGSDRRVTVYAAPEGRDAGRCDARHPCSLARAQEVVRSASHTKRDITVVLDGGTYRLAEPLRFDARDSGRGGHEVTWTAAPREQPTFSGASQVTGWNRVTPASNVWEAPIPADAQLDSRQLYVDGKLATRARTQLPRDAVRFIADGIDLLTPSLSYLNGIQQQDRTEMEFVGSFTHRRSPVVEIADDHMTMAQPAWDNNTWGWDTVQHTFRAGPLYLVNARELLDEPGEWYLDQQAGKVYYQPLDGQDMNRVDVELPRLETLLEIGGTYDRPVHHLRFSGITFTGTTWLEPNTDEGYANQQTGAFLVGDHERASDAFSSCATGCGLFEGTRNTWHQMPAAVQVSAAHDVALTDNVYTNIGAVGVGIGNDANAHATGVGLGAADVLVSRSRFSQHSGQAVVAGGVQPDAHHPSDPRMTNRDITITDNQVHDVASEYKDGAGILVTYVTRAKVTHNEVWNLPYSGINTGYGWGANDPGGSPEYLERGLYDFQPIYQTPTTFRDNYVAFNYIHDVILEMNDAGGFYNLSAAPGSVLEGNYIRMPEPSSALRGGLYFDEGSRYWTVRGNVLDVTTAQLFNQRPNNHTGDVTYTDNWVIGANANFAGRGNVMSGTVRLGRGEAVPLDAARVIHNSGVSPQLRDAPDPTRPELAIETSVDNGEVEPGSTVTATAELTNISDDLALSDLRLTATVPEGWSVSPAGDTPASLEPGGTSSIELVVTAPATASAPIDVGAIQVTVNYTVYGTGASGSGAATALVVSPLTSLRSFGSVPSTFGELDGVYAIRNAGADIWGGGGQSDDEYGAIYAPDAAHDGSVVTVHVDAVEETHPWTKAGLVLRNDATAARESQGYVALVATPGNGVSLQWDSNADGLLDQGRQAGGITAPVWLRLTRSGDQITGSHSTDGTTWTQLGAPVMLTGAAADQDAGMIYTSHSAQAGQTTFSQFSID